MMIIELNHLGIMLPTTNGYVRSYDGKTKWMYFSIEDDELLKNMIFEVK